MKIRNHISVRQFCVGRKVHLRTQEYVLRSLSIDVGARSLTNKIVDWERQPCTSTELVLVEPSSNSERLL